MGGACAGAAWQAVQRLSPGWLQAGSLHRKSKPLQWKGGARAGSAELPQRKQLSKLGTSLEQRKQRSAGGSFSGSGAGGAGHGTGGSILPPIVMIGAEGFAGFAGCALGTGAPGNCCYCCCCCCCKNGCGCCC